MGLLDSSRIALLAAGSTAFRLPVAACTRGCFVSMPGSCGLAARVLDVMERRGFVK